MDLESELTFVGCGPQENSGFTIEYGFETIIVTGWKGSVVRVFLKGKELGSVLHRPPFPNFENEDAVEENEDAVENKGVGENKGEG